MGARFPWNYCPNVAIEQSRGFGFLRFPDLEKAKAFVELNYPTLHLGEDSSDGDGQAVKIRIQYSRERGDRSRSDLTDNEWVCKNVSLAISTDWAYLTLKSVASRILPGAEPAISARRALVVWRATDEANFFLIYITDMAPVTNSALSRQPEFMNSGDSDASTNGAPSQFLLIRNLEPTVTEELLAKGVAKLTKPNATAAQANASQPKKGAKVASTTGDANLGSREGSLRRILLVRDRRSNDSWRYGFAEYASIEVIILLFCRRSY